jgi:outer membrane protein assembly factor BamB
MKSTLLQRSIALGLLVFLGGLTVQAQEAGQQLYGLTYFGNQLFSVDPTMGDGSLVGTFSTPVSGYGIASRYGRLYTFNPNTQEIVEIDPATGALGNSIGIGVTNLQGEGDLAFRNDGVGFLASALHADGSIANDLYTFDVISGTAQRVATTSGAVDAMAFDSDGTLYALGQDDTNLYTLNPNTGVLTTVGPLGVALSSPFAGMTFGPDGILYAAINDQLYTIDKNTGAANVVSTNVLDFGFSSVSGLAFALPSTQLTLATEGGGLVIYWSAAGYTLESATNVTGPYVPTSIQGNPARIAPTNAMMFFRLH